MTLLSTIAKWRSPLLAFPNANSTLNNIQFDERCRESDKLHRKWCIYISKVVINEKMTELYNHDKFFSPLIMNKSWNRQKPSPSPRLSSGVAREWETGRTYERWSSIAIELRVARWNMYFLTKNDYLGIFLRALEFKLLVSFVALGNILESFGLFYGHLVHFSPLLVDFVVIW
jgi:hypothetical protein